MNIVLIGYRGTGKTTVAQELASRLGCDWVDSDAEIERHAGKSIAAIFETVGESGFRELESQRLAELTQRERLVLAVGGGAVLRESNRDRLKSFGHVVWLTADPATILARISGDATSESRRPNLTNVGGLTEIEQVLARRRAIYARCADLVVDTEGKMPADVADEIIRRLDLSLLETDPSDPCDSH